MAEPDDSAPSRAARLSLLAATWVVGLVAGFVGIVDATRRYGCTADNRGLVCRPLGSAFGLVLVVAAMIVIAVVSVVATRSTRGSVTVAAAGLAGCFVLLSLALILLGTS